MKRRLTYEADRNMSLTIEDLRQFIEDADRLRLNQYRPPQVEVRTTGRSDRLGTIRKITGESTR